MRTSHLAAAIACSLIGACAHEAPTVAPATPRSPDGKHADASAAKTRRTLAKDETLTLPSGARVPVSAGWTVEEGKDLRLVAPEGDLTMTLVDVADDDADRAIAHAWALHGPGLTLPVKTRVTPPPSDAWEKVVQVEYRAPAAEHRVVLANARLYRGHQHVVLVDATEAGLDRRMAQLATVLLGYKPAGFEDESLAGRPAKKLDASARDELVAFSERARTALAIPGAALVVVEDGKVALAKGLGVREAGKPEPVTTKTLFMIGSTTKSLTTLMMAKLVDEHAFAWNTPVRKVDPTFSLGDPDASEKITMRHTVCACTGLPRQDIPFLFEYRDVTPESEVKSLATVKPTTGFGETFQYSNVLVATGGFVAARAAMPKERFGPAYDATLASRVLTPLGMSSSTFDTRVVARREHAVPHGQDRTQTYAPAPIATEEGVVPVRPAGALWSNVDDMARFLQVELGKGMLDGKRLFSEENLLERRRPSVRITEKMAYGLGLFVEDEHGIPLVGHGGNNLGFTSDMFMLPEHGIGMVVLTNAGSANAFRNVLRRKLLEIVFGAKPRADEQLAAAVAIRKQRFDEMLEGTAPAPSPAVLSAAAGTWTHPLLGRIVVKGDVLDVGEWKSRFTEKKEKDGSTKLFLLDPPWLGLEVDLRKDASGAAVLALSQGQEEYVLARAK